MTVDQYAELIDFLAKKFGRIDEQFRKIDERFARMHERFDTIEARIERIEGRLDRVEGRLTKVEVGLEDLRGEVRLLAETLSGTNKRLDRYHQDHETRIRALEARCFEA